MHRYVCVNRRVCYLHEVTPGYGNTQNRGVIDPACRLATQKRRTVMSRMSHAPPTRAASIKTVNETSIALCAAQTATKQAGRDDS